MAVAVPHERRDYRHVRRYVHDVRAHGPPRRLSGHGQPMRNDLHGARKAGVATGAGLMATAVRTN